MKKLVPISDVEGRVEHFIFGQITHPNVYIDRFEAADLLTANRFDLAFKLAFLKYREVNAELSQTIYWHDIRSQTLGRFEEYGNPEKNNFDVYVSDFRKTLADLQENSFDETRTLIPLSSNGRILNGAHRLACAIFSEETVVGVDTGLPDVSPDYRYFLERNVPPTIMDIAADTFCDFGKNLYLAFLWPSGRGNYEVTRGAFENIVYEKMLTLTPNGGLNLLIELYKHMDWVGSADQGYTGAQKKLVECFTDFKPFSVILFQCDSLEKVREIKQKVRDVNAIGFSSIHITDTREEVSRVASLIFNECGVHFLNYGKPYTYRSTIERLEALRGLSASALENLVVDGSMTLALYGVREARDVDYLSVCDTSSLAEGLSFDFEEHDSQLVYHGVSKEELIYNPEFYFKYSGVKFVAFDQSFKFKKRRGEGKDIVDCEVMQSSIEGFSAAMVAARVKQYFFYWRVVLKNRSIVIGLALLRSTGTYETARRIIRRLRSLW